MNLLQIYVKTILIGEYLAPAFQRGGFKTEARLLKIQSDQLVKLLGKAGAELSGNARPSLSRRSGGFAWQREVSIPLTRTIAASEKVLEKVGKVDKTLQRTLKKALNNMYSVTLNAKSRRERVQLASRMINALNSSSKKKALSMLSTKS